MRMQACSFTKLLLRRKIRKINKKKEITSMNYFLITDIKSIKKCCFIIVQTDNYAFSS